MADGRSGASERRASRRGGRRSSDGAQGGAELLRRQWEERQRSDTPPGRGGQQPELDEIAGQGAPADAIEGVQVQRGK
jgi:hypothetical protein